MGRLQGEKRIEGLKGDGRIQKAQGGWENKKMLKGERRIKTRLKRESRIKTRLKRERRVKTRLKREGRMKTRLERRMKTRLFVGWIFENIKQK
jgi:hypothetical protein